SSYHPGEPYTPPRLTTSVTTVRYHHGALPALPSHCILAPVARADRRPRSGPRSRRPAPAGSGAVAGASAMLGTGKRGVHHAEQRPDRRRGGRPGRGPASAAVAPAGGR